MALFSGVPRKRRKAVPGGNKIACAICGIPGLSLDMVWMQEDAPGYPRIRAIVHPECKSLPHPSVRHPQRRARPEKPPYIQQAVGISQATYTASITTTAAVFAATGTTSATEAQVTADPTVQLTGTVYTDDTFGRVDAESTVDTWRRIRVTTFNSATSIDFELVTEDIYARTLRVDAAKAPADGGWLISEAISLTIT